MVSQHRDPAPLVESKKLKKHKAGTSRDSTTGRYSVAASVSKTGKLEGPSCIKTVTGKYAKEANKLIRMVNEGLPADAVSKLEKEFRVTRKDMATALRIPTTTLNRRLSDGKLSTDESDRVIRFARIKDLATEMMQGNEEDAIAWLKTPAGILNNESPFDHATTEIGAREVEMLIGRIRHGVFS